MKLAELLTAAEVYVTIPKRIRDIRGFDSRYMRLLGLEPSGWGIRRDYWESDLRRFVAWELIGVVTGRVSGQGAPDVHREAMELLASSEHGWVVMSGGAARWTARPTASVFRNGAVCIRVPDWDRHL